MTKAEEKKIELIMEKLECTRTEAIDVLESDKTIDKGGRTPYDFDKEKEKEAKKIGAVRDRKSKSENNMRGKVRAENPTKSGIIAEIADYLKENCGFATENVTITNKERQIAFKIGENDYEFTLVQKRKKKS